MSEPGQVCVVEVEDVPSRARGRHPVADALAQRPGRCRRGLVAATGRAGKPVEQGDAIGGIDGADGRPARRHQVPGRQ